MFQILVSFQRGAFVAYVPVVAKGAAQRFRLGADETGMQDFRQKVVGLAEIGQQVFVAVRLRISGDGAAHKVKAEALRALVGVELHLPAVHPFALGLVFLLHPDEFPIDLFK